MDVTFQTGSGIHLFSYPMGTGGSLLGVKRQGREAQHSTSTSAEVKIMWIYTATPPYAIIIIIIIIVIIIMTANGALPGGSITTIRHSTQLHISLRISHYAQTKHSTQSYTNNK
jgi:hypothetical protein